jgi:hypothetical protein
LLKTQSIRLEPDDCQADELKCFEPGSDAIVKTKFPELEGMWRGRFGGLVAHIFLRKEV